MITLNAQTEKLLEARLKSGAFHSADEIVQAALIALDESESHGLDATALDAIDVSEDQIDRGEIHDWNNVREQVRNAFLGM